MMAFAGPVLPVSESKMGWVLAAPMQRSARFLLRTRFRSATTHAKPLRDACYKRLRRPTTTSNTPEIRRRDHGGTEGIELSVSELTSCRSLHLQIRRRPRRSHSSHSYKTSKRSRRLGVPSSTFVQMGRRRLRDSDISFRRTGYTVTSCVGSGVHFKRS